MKVGRAINLKYLKLGYHPTTRQKLPPPIPEPPWRLEPSILCQPCKHRDPRTPQTAPKPPILKRIREKEASSISFLEPPSRADVDLIPLRRQLPTAARLDQAQTCRQPPHLYSRRSRGGAAQSCEPQARRFYEGLPSRNEGGRQRGRTEEGS